MIPSHTAHSLQEVTIYDLETLQAFNYVRDYRSKSKEPPPNPVDHSETKNNKINTLPNLDHSRIDGSYFRCLAVAAALGQLVCGPTAQDNAKKN